MRVYMTFRRRHVIDSPSCGRLDRRDEPKGFVAKLPTKFSRALEGYLIAKTGFSGSCPKVPHV